LFSKAVSHWEKVPASLLIHIPNVCLLTGIFRIGLIDQVHQEEHVICEIMLLRNMLIKIKNRK
jgi:hypothetical protein